ncbi:pre-mRNA-splicing factor spp2 [Aspergillus udagawae]|nr:pre-mRNA-splicing factor spp2 [Aspergillus udagawae]
MSSSEPPKDGKPSSKPFSLSLSGSGSNGQSKKSAFSIPPSRAAEPPSRTLARRPHRLHDDESDEDEAPPAFEAVAGFDTHTGTVLSADGRAADKAKRELVIPVASKNNWRDRVGVSRGPRGKNLLPKEVQAMQEAQRRGETAEGNQEADHPSMSYGLSFAKPSQGEETKPGEDQAMQDAGPLIPPVVDERQPLTQDEIALQALIRESKGETEGRTDLVIESTKRETDEGYPVRVDETGSFRVDVASRPEPATLDQYNAIPVEEFGAALLRGMGWKEGQSIGRGKYGTSATDDRSQTPRIPERRPGFLGIGAKDVSGGKGAEAELGAWGKAAMRKGARKAGEAQGGEGNTQGVYMPVLMRNKKTGEYITEEELTALKKEGKAKKDDDDDWRERRDRNLEKSGRDRDRDRDRNGHSRRRDYDDDDSDRSDRRRTGSSRRDRSLSSSDRQSRQRKYEDEDGSRRDDRYYRDRDRDRDRRDRDRDRERDKDRDRDRDRERSRDRSSRYRDDNRYRSRHSSSHASSRHGRDRDSDRDSHRRRRHDD